MKDVFDDIGFYVERGDVSISVVPYTDDGIELMFTIRDMSGCDSEFDEGEARQCCLTTSQCVEAIGFISGDRIGVVKFIEKQTGQCSVVLSRTKDGVSIFINEDAKLAIGASLRQTTAKKIVSTMKAFVKKAANLFSEVGKLVALRVQIDTLNNELDALLEKERQLEVSMNKSGALRFVE